jgi:hypothetical protein
VARLEPVVTDHNRLRRFFEESADELFDPFLGEPDLAVIHIAEQLDLSRFGAKWV